MRKQREGPLCCGSHLPLSPPPITGRCETCLRAEYYECQRTDSLTRNGRTGLGAERAGVFPMACCPSTSVSLRPTVGRADVAEQLTMSHTSLSSQHNPCHALWQQPKPHPMRAQGTPKWLPPPAPGLPAAVSGPSHTYASSSSLFSLLNSKCGIQQKPFANP